MFKLIWVLFLYIGAHLLCVILFLKIYPAILGAIIHWIAPSARKLTYLSTILANIFLKIIDLKIILLDIQMHLFIVG